MLVIGFTAHFWVTPKEALSANDVAAANVARVEAQVKGGTSTSATQTKMDTSKFLDELKNTQEQQTKYATIFLMLFGAGFLGYSFVKKD